MLRDLCSFDCQLELENYNIKGFLGKGGFAAVFSGTDKKTGEDIAIKIFPSLLCDKDRIDFSRNILTSSYLNIPGVVKLIGYRLPLSEEEKKDPTKILSIPYGTQTIDCTGYILFMELVKYKDISKMIKSYLNRENNQQNILNPTIRSKIIFGVSSTMKKFHHKKQIHRDLKAEAVYLDDRLEPKIGSLFLSKYVVNNIDMTMAVGTPFSMAPEIFMDGDEIYSFPVDVYSFAIFLYQMFTTKLEFDDGRKIRSAQQYMMKIGRGKRPMKQDTIPDIYWDLIQKCWKQDPSERPTFDEITEMLKDDRYAIEEFGIKTNLDELHEYQRRIELL